MELISRGFELGKEVPYGSSIKVSPSARRKSVASDQRWGIFWASLAGSGPLGSGATFSQVWMCDKVPVLA